jgi:hypothetical protein
MIHPRKWCARNVMVQDAHRVMDSTKRIRTSNVNEGAKRCGTSCGTKHTVFSYPAVDEAAMNKIIFKFNESRLKLKRKPPQIIDASEAFKIVVKKCKAITLAGKPCPFHATKGLYCSKHSV